MEKFRVRKFCVDEYKNTNGVIITDDTVKRKEWPMLLYLDANLSCRMVAKNKVTHLFDQMDEYQIV